MLTKWLDGVGEGFDRGDMAGGRLDGGESGRRIIKPPTATMTGRQNDTKHDPARRPHDRNMAVFLGTTAWLSNPEIPCHA